MTTVAYMLSDPYGEQVSGPYFGEVGLDFTSLAREYRDQLYAEYETRNENFCWLTHSQFVSWLLKQGHLQVMETQAQSIDIDDLNRDKKYAPKHWPVCPECDLGRGEEDAGTIRRSLNRRDWYLKCTECGHTWGHHDEPYTAGQPMLEDDGRDVPGGCVPYSISQAGGIPMPTVINVCRTHGWREGYGLDESKAVQAAHQLGIKMIELALPKLAGKLSISKLLQQLSPTKTYIISTRDHWLAVVNGDNRDQSATHGRKNVSRYWEVVPS